MQNKGAIWVFTILLAIASLYQISFSFFTTGFENKAEEYALHKVDSVQTASGELGISERDELRERFVEEYLRNNADQVVYPVFGFTYAEAKDKEINLGLDLKGGMSVTLEVSVPDLIVGLSGNSNDPDFRKSISEAREMQVNSQDDFVSLFARAWENNAPDKKLAAVFHSRENRERFPREASNSEIINTLRQESITAVDNTEKILRTRIDKFGVTQPTIQKQQISGRITIDLPGVKDKERVRKVLRSTANLEFWNTYENVEIYPMLEQLNDALSAELYPEYVPGAVSTTDDSSTEIADETTEADELAASSDTLSGDTIETEEDLLSQLSAGSDSLEEDLTDMQLSDEEQRKQFPLFSLMSPNVFDNQLSQGPVVGLATLSDTAAINELLNHRVARELLPKDLRLLWSAKPDARMGNLMQLYAIKVDTRDRTAPLDGSVIVDASQDFDVTGQVQVMMQMNSEGAKLWKDMTANAASQSPKRCVAIVLDDYVYSAPVVQGEIPNGRSSISMGRGTKTEQIVEADDLANLLKAGALPAPANIVDEVVVGPTLGQENIDSGLMSFIIAFILVMAFMAFYYRGAGVVTNIALISNIFFLFGALASIQASLTLPGIAGIILTIGMAVDANVLIYERIREALRKGKGVKAAVKEGYAKAYSAIIDANITTLLVGIVLLVLGTGPVKGFATTLIIGILTSLFSAIFVARLIFEAHLSRNASISFIGKSSDWFRDPKYNFIGNRKKFYILSGAIVLICFGSLTFRSLDYGVDFIGGRTYDVMFENPQNIEEVRDHLTQVFISEDGLAMSPEVKTIGTSNQLKITTKYLIEDSGEDADLRAENALREGLNNTGDSFELIGSRKVDATISGDFQQTSTLAVIFSLFMIFVYILFRFKRWEYGTGAVIGMVHNVILVLGCFSLFYGILPFSMEIDQAFIAAILTVVGYSINDTVVVFDRVREEVQERPKDEISKVLNRSINNTLSRTVITSLTTFLVLLGMFVFGGSSIRGFIFALMIGVVVGTYSTICIAAPIVYDLWKRKTTTKA